MVQFPDRSDFHTNGRMWIVLTIEMIDIIPVPVFLLIVFGLVIPRWLDREHRRAQGMPRTFPLIFAIAVIELVLLSPFYWGASERIWLIGAGPVVAVTAIAATLYMHRVIRRSKQGDLPHGDASGGKSAS